MTSSSRSTLADRSAFALGERGEIARGLALTGVMYEARDGQQQMTRKVAEAIVEERVLLCEAGTGTGKTLAYLVPAILSGRRIVVSTATKALQEQLYLKDIPFLSKHLGAVVHASLMKGLSNYLCLRRFNEALRVDSSSRERGYILSQIEQWIRDTESGDRAELDVLREDDPTWREVQSGSDTRIGQGCPYAEDCFVTKMREAAQTAKLVVVNHHLYLADIALRRGGAWQGVLPEHDVVIFDEAHQLEDIATEFFGVRISSAKIESCVRDAKRLWGLTDHAHITKLFPKQETASRTVRSRLSEKRAEELKALLQDLVTVSQSFFEAVRRDVRLTDGRTKVNKDFWTSELTERVSHIELSLDGILAFGRLRDAEGEIREEVQALMRRFSNIRDELSRTKAPKDGEVAWIDVRARNLALGVSPIELGSVFREELFAAAAHGKGRPSTIVLTSATLAVGSADSPFSHTKRRLGLWASSAEVSVEKGVFSLAPLELVVPSPFDYERNAGLYVPVDLPEPQDPPFVDAAAKRAVDLIHASRGGAFVLCASKNNMQAIHFSLLQMGLPYPLMMQGDQPKSAQLASFRAAGNAILVATLSFWEGVDVPGSALRLVILDKLPFAVPTDPVTSARFDAIASQGRSPFLELSVPDAAIMLKQGFGRLIRTRNDRGVVAILDKRIRKRGYGQILLDALPKTARLRTLEEARLFLQLVCEEFAIK